MAIPTLRWSTKSLVNGRAFGLFRNFVQIPRTNRPISRLNEVRNFRRPKIEITSCANYSDHSEPSWKRPEGPPRVWRAFDGRKKSDDGTTPRFTVQEVPEDRTEDMIDFMAKYFLSEELFFVTLGATKEPLAVEEMREKWRETARQRISIVAFLSNEKNPETKPTIIGANVLHVITVKDKVESRGIDQFKSKALKKFWGMLYDLESNVDVFNVYGVDKYLASVGLLVHPQYRGHGIGEKMLRLRDEIGRAYGVSATETMFTMKSSQISAKRAGFELRFEKKFSELLDYEGNPVFPDKPDGTVHVMTKRLR